MEVLYSVLHRSRALWFVFLATTLVTAGISRADTVSDAAAVWLIGQQIPSSSSTAPGAFPWQPGGAATSNTQGATALGLLRAYERSGNANDLNAAIANGDCQIAGDSCISGWDYGDGHHHFATHDPLFLVQLSLDSGDPKYAQFVDDEFWSRLANGQYGASANLSASGYANAVLTSRTGQGYADLVGWDLSKAAIAASLAGETATRDAFMQAILGSLNASDSSNTTFDVIGLAGAVWASAETGVDLNPTGGKWASANSTADLAAMLATYQAPGGGFVGSTTASGGIVDSNTDTQTTAFAMQALDAVDSVQYASAVQNGFAYISGMQQSSGEFLSAPGAATGAPGSVELQGETLEAYASIVQRPQDVYVDDDYAGDAFGTSESFTHPQVNGGSATTVVFGQDAFATITDALANVANGGSVYVATGTYVEGSAASQQNLVVTRPVNLIGAQASVDARNRTDTGASIIEPGFANASLSYSSQGDQVIVQIASDDVRLDGFVLDGDNPNLSSGVVMGTADPDVDSGIYATGSHIDISNNVVRNLVYAGIYNYNYPASVPAGVGNAIRHNWIRNIDAPSEWGIGIAVLWNYYADIDANLLTNVRVGIQTNFFFKPTANPAVDAQIRDNEVHASANAIYHNYQDASGSDVASPWTIAGNQILAENNPDQGGIWTGLAFQGLYAGTADIHDNGIDGSALAGSARTRAGYRINLITSPLASSTSIAGGTVSHVDYGVLATDGAYYAGALDDMGFSGIAFDDVSIAAFYVEDTALAGSEPVDNAPKITVGAGNTFNAVAHEAALAGPQASIAFAAGAPLFNTVLVRAANDGHRPGEADSNGNVRHVENAIINQGIAIAASSGTVDVDGGTFDQNVVVNKGVTLHGAMHGIPGFDASRDGSGETTISPSSGSVFSMAADNAVVDGFTASMASGVAVTSGGSSREDMQFTNNRVVDIADGVGIRFEPGEGSPASGLTVSDNLFANIAGSGTNGSAIELYKGTRDATVSDNHFDSIKNVAVQVNGGNGTVQNTTISGNVIGDSQSVGSSNAFVATNVSGMSITGNAVSGVSTGLFVSDQDSQLEFSCNTVDSANRGISTYDFFGGTINTDVRIFDNAITASAVADVNNSMAQTLTVGSNWYGGSEAVVTGNNVQVASALATNPIGNAACGNNSTATIMVYAGDQQHALITSAFGSPLVVRVLDALGGAVMGEPVTFAPPASGASASLASVSGASNYNGEFSTTAVANGTAGSYNVLASSGSLSPDASFTLHNERVAASIILDPAALSSVYDGSPHAVAATTDPSGLSYSVTYDGSSTPPTNAGEYSVVATITDPGYVGTGSGELTIAKAEASVSLSDLTQVHDGNAKPVTVSTTPSGLAVDVTYDGSSTVPSAVGNYVVAATVNDPDYQGSANGVLHITEAPLKDLSVTMTNGRDYAQYGHVLSYAIVISNVGNEDITGATINDVLPASLLPIEPVTWHCFPNPNASCTAISGTGDLSTTADVLAGGSVTIILDTVVNDDKGLGSDQIQLTATATASGDMNSANNSATDLTQAVIFRAGFEVGGDGAQALMSNIVSGDRASLDANNSQMLDLRRAWDSTDGIIEAARLRTGNGDRVRVEALHLGARLWVRLAGQVGTKAQLSAWTEVTPGTAQLALGLAESGKRTMLLLVGGSRDLQLQLSDGAATLQVWGPPTTDG
ncbi:MAG: MBG domain-containing protein [Rhodanobacteraceae bacterium]